MTIDNFANFARQKIDITDDEKKEKKVKTVCYLCDEKFDQNLRSCTNVRDHCHCTVRYQVAAYSVYTHNASGFDNYLAIPKIVENFNDCSFWCIDKEIQEDISFFG